MAEQASAIDLKCEVQSTSKSPRKSFETQDQSSSTNCTSCNTPQSTNGAKINRCGGCKKAAYYSKACQTDDWKYHKYICKQLPLFEVANPRPSKSHRLAFILPADEKAIEMVWIDSGPRLETPNFRHLISPKEMTISATRYLAYKYPKFRRFDLDHNIQVVFDSSMGGRSNACVTNVLKGTAKYYWKGPIIILSDYSDEYHVIEDGPAAHMDVTPSDLRIGMDFFYRYDAENDAKLLDHGKPDLGVLEESLLDFVFTPAAQTHAVRINCEGDMHFLGAPMYVEEYIISNNSIFSMTPAAITKQLGLPMMVSKINANQDLTKGEIAWKREFGFNPRINQMAPILNISVDPSDRKNFCWVDMQEWDFIAAGSVMVVREDRKPVTAEQVEAIAEFIYTKVLKQNNQLSMMLLGYYDDEEIENARTQFVKECICQAKFEEFFEELKNERIERGDKYWENVVSPYEI